MRKSIVIGIALLTVFLSFAQNNTINYKILVGDSSGNPLANQATVIRFTVFSEATQVYQETHNTTTDVNGIAIVNIGAGTSGDLFTDINWSSGTTSLQTELDTGSGFVDIGTEEFKSVPYALNAGNGSGLKEVTENLNTGWRLETNPILDGGAIADIGDKAVDMTIHDDGFWFLSGASGPYSFAANKDNLATGSGSSAFGNSSRVTGVNSISAGTSGDVSGNSSFGFGNGLLVSANSAMAVGAYNVDDANALFMVGNGTDDLARNNAMTVTNTGKTTVNESTASSANHAISGIKTHTGFADAAGVYGENTVEDYYGIGVIGKGGWKGVEGEVFPTGSGGSYFGMLGAVYGSNAAGLGTNYGVYGTSISAGAINYAVYAAGDLAHTGALINASDRKLKTNINAISNSLESISLLNPTTYSIKESYQKRMNMSSKPQFGFLAQELQEVFPDLVSFNKHPGATKEAAPIEYLGVNYVGLIPILTAGIKEQQQLIEQQQQTINEQQQTLVTQQQMLQDLLARVETLENR